MKSNTPEKRTIESRTIERGKQEERTNTRSWWIKTILLLTLVVLSVVMLFTLGDYLTGEDTPQLGFGQLLKTINYPLFALLLAVVVLYIAVESAKYAYMLKMYTGKFRFRIAVKTMFLGKYYDGITPLSTGGQPFQIYYLHKKKIPSGAANVIPVARYVMSAFVLTVFAVTLLALTPRYVPQDAVGGPLLLIFAWASLGVNIAFQLAVILFSVFPKACKKFILFLVYWLHKFRLVKRRYRTSIKFVREMRDYSDCLKQFWRQFYKFLPMLLLCVIESGLFVTLPFFVVISIANVPPTVELAVQIACLVVISRYSSLLVPTPGNTGALEAASSLIFVTVTGIGSVLGWTVLVWRFFTYYVYILSGIGINIFEVIRSAVRRRRAARTAQKPL